MVHIRDWIGLQKEMVQEVASILGIGLLAVNLSLTLALVFRGQAVLDFLATAPGLALSILAIALSVWAVARAWHFMAKMHKSKQRAVVTLNPYLTTDFNPHEWMIWHEVLLPQMRYQLAMMRKLELDTKDIEARIARVEDWLRRGQIPREEFPPVFEPYLRAT